MFFYTIMYVGSRIEWHNILLKGVAEITILNKLVKLKRKSLPYNNLLVGPTCLGLQSLIS